MIEGRYGPLTGAEALVRVLAAEGIDTVFGTVGHGNLAFVDALLDSDIRYVPVFHEQVAAHAADAYFRASGRVAAVTTTVGPGFTNLATGLGDALLDSSAMVVIAGGIPSAYVGKDALQELSVLSEDGQTELLRPIVKRVTTVRRAEDLAHHLHLAVRDSVAGCPGPTILHVPLDLFSAPVDPPDMTSFRPSRRMRPAPDADEVRRAADLMAASHRPLILAGGGVLLSNAGEALTELAEEFALPVATTMSGQGAISEDHPLSLGFTGVVGCRPANTAARAADLVLAVGTRLPEMDTSSWRSDFFTAVPPATLVHLDIDPRQIDKVLPAAAALVGDARVGIEHLGEALRDEVGAHPSVWSGWVEETATAKDAWEGELAEIRASAMFPYEPGHLLTELQRLVPSEVVLVTGVGIRHLVGQYFMFGHGTTQIVASGFGTMGQEVAAPLGTALARPDLPTVALVGDGAMLACLAAIPSAVAAGVHAIWIVLDNGGYGSIAVYQHKHYGRHLGTYFQHHGGEEPYRPDYAAMSRAFGANAVTVTDPSQLDEVVGRALRDAGVWVIEVPVTPTPRVLASGHWDVNDILAAGAEISRERR